MAVSDLYAIVTLTERPLWKRILRLPRVFQMHRRLMREHGTGRIVSMYAAWKLAGVTVHIKGAGS